MGYADQPPRFRSFLAPQRESSETRIIFPNPFQDFVNLLAKPRSYVLCFSPPLVLIGRLPPSLVAPLAAQTSPAPYWQKPIIWH